ncbi:MAG: hypothetical protein HS122_02275 [Opitutaceae bacterium]|nr:hypothetical protein [Opitutaceae bacterium]
MKLHSILLATFLASTCSALVAVPLGVATTAHIKPDATSAKLATLAAGTELKPVAGAASAPGWLAIEVTGPHDVFVQNKEITKSLDVRPGAELRLEPSATAPIVALANAGETLDITGLHGRWTKLRMNRTLTGYIKLPTARLPEAAVPVGTRAPAPGTPSPAPVAPPPTAPAAYGTSTPGAAAPAVGLSDSSAGVLPRTFQGRFVSTRSPFKPRRPYDWALTDESGTRFAYLDVSRLLQTEQIEKYADRFISVFGAAKPLPNSKDFVIVVESLQLK